MGGKQKQSQRTKGNVKPSSSGRSAALLANSSFTGFTGMKEHSPIFSTFQAVSGSDDIDPYIDSNYQLVLKKMSKKDPTTRLKALQEFSKLVESSDIEVIKAVLPFWPRLYCALAGDSEHRVREAAHDAQRSLVLQAKRNMAPYLRQIAGPWFTAQFETYPPAASAAMRAFQDAFPSNKLTEAVVFCHEEILKYICENLLATTQQSGSNQNDERTDKQERILVACLQGYANFVHILPEESLASQSFTQPSGTLIESKNFWETARDKATVVRCAWLSALTAVLEKAPQLFEQRHQQVIKIVFARLEESDPVVMPFVWQAVLSVISTLQDWQIYCNVEKHVFPRLWATLREGGYGNAISIFPNILPLLSSFIEIKKPGTDRDTFIDNFFSSLREGFIKKCVIQSRSESEAVAQAYMECIRFVATKDLVGGLVDNHVIPVIEMTLTQGKLQLLSRPLFEQMSIILNHWSRNNNIPSCILMYDSFWKNLSAVYSKLTLVPANTSKVYILNQQVELCLSLKDTTRLKKKLSRKVRFSGEDPPEEQIKTSGNDISTGLTYTAELSKKLQEFVSELCVHYLQEVKEKSDLTYIVPLYKLLSTFMDAGFYKVLTSQFNIVEFFPDLQRMCLEDSVEFVDVTVNLAFCMIEHMQPTERNQIFNAMCQEPDILIWVLRAAQKVETHPSILEWLRGPSLYPMLQSLTQQVCSASESQNTKPLLMGSVAKAPDGSFLVNSYIISLILSKLCVASDETEIASFMAEFLSAVCNFNSEDTVAINDELATSIQKTVTTLFCRCCDVQENMSYSDREIMTSGWQDGIVTLTRMRCMEVTVFVTDFSAIVRGKLLERKMAPHDDLQDLVETAANFVNTVCSNNSLTCKADICNEFLDGMRSDYDKWHQEFTQACQDVEMLLGAPDYITRKRKYQIDCDKIVSYVNLSLFTAMLISRTVLNVQGSKYNSRNEVYETEREEENDDVTSEDFINDGEAGPNEMQSGIDENVGEDMGMFLRDSHLEEKILQVAVSVAVCDIFTIYFQSTSYYTCIRPHICFLRMNFRRLIRSLNIKEAQSHLQTLAHERAVEHGGIWVWSLYILRGKFQNKCTFKSLVDQNCTDYAARVLFKLAQQGCEEVPLQILDENVTFNTLRYWLNHTTPVVSSQLSDLIKEPMHKWLNTDRKELLYDCDVSLNEWEEVDRVVKMIYYLSACIDKCPLLLDQRMSDFIIISAAYYAQSLKQSYHHLFSLNDKANFISTWSLDSPSVHKVSIFTMATFDLLSNLTRFCRKANQKEFSTQEERYEDLANEWKNVFADDVHETLLYIFTAIADCITARTPSILGHMFLQNFSNLVMSIDVEFLLNKDEQKDFAKKLLKSTCQLINSPVLSLQTAAHKLLRKFASHLSEADATFVGIEDREEILKDVTKYEIIPLFDAMQNTQTVVDTMLAEFSFGDSCIVQPHTDTYYFTTAYLMLWDLLLEVCGQSGSELRYHYSTLLRTNVYNLLNNLLFLIPAEAMELETTKQKSAVLENMFTEAPDLDIDGICTSQQLQHWATWVYYCTLSRLPVLVRHWWADTKPKVSSMVQRATLRYVSPVLCTRELQSIHDQHPNFNNMEVKVLSKAREVIAIYAVDEVHMELVITLPDMYPLGAVQVDSRATLIGTSEWRGWVKQLGMFLTHQNGSLWDGLLLWKSNLDKRFNGVEECYICFSVLHGTNFQLPKVCCKTCKKKFHSPCLYKWFYTSNKSTCPICRNLF